MIKKSTATDFNTIYEIINDAAIAYKGVIPADRWHEPYMSKEELKIQMDEGVEFFCYWHEDEIIGVMGIQDKIEVTLIRHAYVKTNTRGQGIGSKLLAHLTTLTSLPILIGTWAEAKWAISFYEKHGFHLVSFDEKERLLRKYWNIPMRQIDTSVVLSNTHSLDSI